MTVGSHDTASAVVGVPMTEADDAAYISCGTWGLVGVELDAPVVTAAARTANFTNEGGVDGRTRFLTNVMGTWLLSETLRTWEAAGSAVSLPALLQEAASVTAPVPVFDVQDPRFLPPGDMPARIASLCSSSGLPVPSGRAALVRSIVESLAEGFVRALSIGSVPLRALDPGRPRRRRWSPERVAVPGDRRPHRVARRGRTGRGDGAGQRAGAGARGGCGDRGARGSASVDRANSQAGDLHAVTSATSARMAP